MLHPTEKMVQALVHTTRSLRAIFRKHKVKVITDRPMEEILKLFGKEGRLAKWATKIQTYNILYTQRKEAEGSIVKKFFDQGEQVHETLDANERGTFNLNKMLQEKSTTTPRAWRLYLGKETIKEGSSVGIILISLEKRMHSYAIRLKFNTSDDTIDCEALLARLAASISKGMKELHVFMDSPKLVAQTEGNHTPTMEQEMHKFLNQEVSVGIKTRPSVEETSSNKKGKAASNVPVALCNPSEHDKVKFYWTNNNDANTKNSPSEHPKEKYNLDTATILARAKPNKRSGDADLSKDKSGPESPLEFKKKKCPGLKNFFEDISARNKGLCTGGQAKTSILLTTEPILTRGSEPARHRQGYSVRVTLLNPLAHQYRRLNFSSRTIKNQKTPSKNKEPTHLIRSRRLEDQSTTRENARREMSKSRRKRFEHQETSSDSEYD
ncbi:hypothetical protein Tco_0195926 [Tanacetum coccineum]